ncbi:sugar transporter domain-containing protein [Sarocladium implicatum]|nr:sugar transporter domain-containing protein [Sarocladium implicatum]
MVRLLSPPPRTTNVKSGKPPKGSFFFAGRTWPSVKWWTRPNMRKLYFFVTVLVMNNIAHGFDSSMMNGLQSLSYWREYFDEPSGPILSIMTAIITLGSISALPFIPPLIDNFGRKSGIYLGSMMVFVGVGLQAGARNIGMFLGGRFLLGFGLTLTLGPAPILVSEIAHPQHRAICTTLFGVSWFVGSFTASWVTYGTLQIDSHWSWRLPSLLQCCCTLLILPCMPWVLESPRFYIAKDRFEEAKKLLAYYHAEGDEDDELVNLEYEEIYTTLQLDKELGKTTGYADFLRTPGNRKRLMLVVAMCLFQQWSGGGLIGYYMRLILENVGITDAQDQLGINGGLRAWALLVNAVFAFFIDFLGRRQIMLISTVGMTVAFIVWTILSARYEIGGQNDPALGRGVVVMIFVYDSFNNFQTGVQTTYNLEILPYGLRAKGGVIGSFTVLVALFFNQFVNSIAIKEIAWRYYIVYCGFLAFQCWFIYTQLIETRYTPLEEITKYFDGDEKDIVELTNAHAKGAMAEGEHLERTEGFDGVGKDNTTTMSRADV